MNPMAIFAHLPIPGKIAVIGVPALGGALLLKGKLGGSAKPGVGTPSGSFTETISSTVNNTIIHKVPRGHHSGPKHPHKHPPHHKPVPRPTHNYAPNASWWEGRIAQTENQLSFIARWRKQAKRTNNRKWLGELNKRQSHFQGQLRYQKHMASKAGSHNPPRQPSGSGRARHPRKI